jgi:predicted choloylglycine hydrolase
MRFITLHGDHRQMGLQHGRQLLDLRPRIVEVIDRRLASLEDRPVDGLLSEVEQCWAREARSTLDMLAGMADAFALDRARLFRYALSSYLADAVGVRAQAEGCTVWAASGPATAGGTPILVKNRDYSLSHTALQILAHATPELGYRYLYVASAGSVGASSSGINEMGLAVADTHVLSSDLGPGLARYTLMMEMLEQHASVASALDYLRRAPRIGGGNLILADAAGEMAVFETGHRHWGIVPASDHIVAATNHFNTPDLRGHYLGRDQGGADSESEARGRSIHMRLRDHWGRLDVDQTRRIMASHADGEAAICRHDAGDASGTISSVIFLPAERSLMFCDGRPCEAGFTRHAL